MAKVKSTAEAQRAQRKELDSIIFESGPAGEKLGKKMNVHKIIQSIFLPSQPFF
jgi:hypothetical protein